ncbi:hypothetical protein [Caldithrix abyssi]
MVQTKHIFTIKDSTPFLTQKVVSEFDEQMNELTRLIYKNANQLLLVVKKEFNVWQSITRSSTFDGQGRLRSSVIYEYDRKGNLREKKFLDKNREIISRQLWKFDAHQSLTLYEKYGLEERLLERKVFEYENGNLSSVKIFNPGSDAPRLKRYFYDEEGREMEEKIFNESGNLIALKRIQYNKVKLPRLILWFDGSHKLQRTEKFEYYTDGTIKSEEVDDLFGNQYFRKKFDVKGNVLEASHLKQEFFENLEIYRYDNEGKKVLQEKYSIKFSKKTLKQQIFYEYKDGKIKF